MKLWELWDKIVDKICRGDKKFNGICIEDVVRLGFRLEQIAMGGVPWAGAAPIESSNCRRPS
jgi:hypothetical protein